MTTTTRPQDNTTTIAQQQINQNKNPTTNKQQHDTTINIEMKRNDNQQQTTTQPQQNKIACLHVSFTAHENFYKLSKMHCHLVLTFHFMILRMSEFRNPTIKHISTYTLVSSSITTYVTDFFLGSNPHRKIPF